MGVRKALVTIVTVGVTVVALPLTGAWHLGAQGRPRRDRATEPPEQPDVAPVDDDAPPAEIARLKKQFLTTMHHELRTPMNGVLGMAELLLNSGLTAEQVELVETLSASGLRLMATINDLLERTELEIDTIDVRESVDAVDDSSASRPVVLVVEDDEITREATALLLEQIGCTVHTAASNADALDMLDTGVVDAIVMDHDAPAMDGVEPAQLIRSRHHRAYDIPIIPLTQSPPDSQRSEYPLGMTDYLVKPSSRRDLIASLRRHGLRVGLESAET